MFLDPPLIGGGGLTLIRLCLVCRLLGCDHKCWVVTYGHVCVAKAHANFSFLASLLHVVRLGINITGHKRISACEKEGSWQPFTQLFRR